MSLPRCSVGASISRCSSVALRRVGPTRPSRSRRRTTEARFTCSTPRAWSTWCPTYLSSERRAGVRREKPDRTREVSQSSLSIGRTESLSRLRSRERTAFRSNGGQKTCLDPAFQGRRVIDDISLDDIACYIDWTLFFSAWELKGKFPEDLRARASRSRRRASYTTMHKRFSATSSLRSFSFRVRCTGSGPANRDGDDVIVWAHEETPEPSSCASTCSVSRR